MTYEIQMPWGKKLPMEQYYGNFLDNYKINALFMCKTNYPIRHKILYVWVT